MSLETNAAWEKLCCSDLTWYCIAEKMKAYCQEKERERDEAREELSLKCQSVTIASGTISDLFKKSERLEKQIEGLNNFANERFDEIQRVRRERDEAREQNAKLREIAEWFANHFVDECWHLPHEDHEVHDKSVLSCCPVIEKGYQLRAELDQIKEGRK